MSHDRILQQLIYSTFNPSNGAQRSFEDKLTKQSQMYTAAIENADLNVLEGEALGVKRVKFNERETQELQHQYSDDPRKFTQVIHAGKRVNEISDPVNGHDDSLSGRDIEAVKELLKNLVKDGKLYNHLVNYHNTNTQNMATSDHERKTAVIMCLHHAGMLPVIRYVICDALLTGGIGCGQVRIPDQSGKLVLSDPAALVRELQPLIAATGFAWEDFFTLGCPLVLYKSIVEMACELDQPEILLAVLGKEKFSLQDVKKSYNDLTRQTLYDYIISRDDKFTIEKRMQKDLANERIARLNASKTFPALAPTANAALNEDGVASAMPKSASSPSLSYTAANTLFQPAAAFNSSTFDDDAMYSLVNAFMRISHAAEEYIKLYPQPINSTLHKHQNQSKAELLIKMSKKLFEAMTQKDKVSDAIIAKQFLEKFRDIYMQLWNGELKTLLSDNSITAHLNVVSHKLSHYNQTQTQHTLANPSALTNRVIADLQLQPTNYQSARSLKLV